MKTETQSGECQICGRMQKLDARGRLVHHGYRRPGWGWQTASCPGTKWAPFPMTDKLEAVLPGVEAEVAKQSELARTVPQVRVEISWRYVSRVRVPSNAWVADHAAFVRLVAEYQAHADAGDAEARRTTIAHGWGYCTAEQVAGDRLNGWDARRRLQAGEHERQAAQAQEWVDWANLRITRGRELREQAAACA